MSKLRRARHPQTPPPQTWGSQEPGTPPQQGAQPLHPGEPTQQGAQPSYPGEPPYPGQPLQQDTQPPPPKKRHRVFFWFFLAVQVGFLIWVIAGASTGKGTPSECSGLTGDDLRLCKDAHEVGTTIGVGLIIGLWVAVDFILGLTYLIYRLARRQPRT